MLKITYPNKNLAAFERSYKTKLNSANLDNALNIFLYSDVAFAPLRVYTASQILTANIADLFTISNAFSAIVPAARIVELKEIFNYDKKEYSPKYQDSISEFFMDAADLNLVSCYFCNIDHINSFDPLDDYADWNEFYKKATKEELMQIQGIADASADKIIAGRNAQPITNVGLTPSQINNLKRFTYKAKKNHFTLDHVLDKATHPIAALSLYNFVPSCYGCNSKFKRSTPIVTSAAMQHVSPTSTGFAFSKNVRFKIFYNTAKARTLLDIKTPGDFVLNYEIDAAGKDYEAYIKTFKLRARYKFHKGEVLKLVKKKKKYSLSQLKEISRITGIGINQLKSDIYGEELFNNEYDNSPLTKLKRDIARDIGIDGVL